ncbi:MAG: hypothetical protein ACOY42_01590 [Pseudomonadota bacterium]|jgi:hypothetical protein
MSKIRIPNIEHLLPRPAARVSRETIAYHEAGHVLVSHYYRREVLLATLDEHGGQGAGNQVHFASNWALEALLRRTDDPARLWPEAVRQTQVTVRILLGGPAAQALHQRVPFEQVDGGDDYRTAVRSLLFLEKLRLQHPELAAVDLQHRRPEALDSLAGEARGVVEHSRNRPYLARVARRLLAGGPIAGPELRELLDGMQTEDPLRDIRRKLHQPPPREA